MIPERSSKNYKTSSGDVPLTDIVVDMRTSMYSMDRDILREKGEEGWRCPYCGKKFKHKIGKDSFTIDEHLYMSPDCLKELKEGFRK